MKNIKTDVWQIANLERQYGDLEDIVDALNEVISDRKRESTEFVRLANGMAHTALIASKVKEEDDDKEQGHDQLERAAKPDKSRATASRSRKKGSNKDAGDVVSSTTDGK